MRFKLIVVCALIILGLNFHDTSHSASLEVKQNDVVLTGTDGIKNTDGDYVTIPPGVIVMWSGSIASIPSGWTLCDGTNGAPNLTDRFVIHADADSGGANNVGDTGGSSSHTHQTPDHNHQWLTNSGKRSYNSSGGTNGFTLGSGGGTYVIDIIKGSGAIVSSHYTSKTGGADTTSSSNIPKFYALAYIMKL